MQNEKEVLKIEDSQESSQNTQEIKKAVSSTDIAELNKKLEAGDVKIGKKGKAGSKATKEPKTGEESLKKSEKSEDVQKSEEPAKKLEKLEISGKYVNKWGDLFIGRKNTEILKANGLMPKTGVDYVFKAKDDGSVIFFKKEAGMDVKETEDTYIVRLWPNGSFFHKKHGKQVLENVAGILIGVTSFKLVIQEDNCGYLLKE